MSRFAYLILFVIVNRVSSTPGDLQAFGEAGKEAKLEEIEGEYPDLFKFFTYYLPKSDAFVARQVLNRDLYFNIWKADDQMETEVDGLGKATVHVESFEKRQRSQMKFGDFLDKYQREQLMLADHLPEVLRKYLVVPRPFQCDAVLPTLQSVLLIINGMHSSPLIFNEEFDALMCLYRGQKQIVLVNAKKYPAVREYVAPGKRQARPLVVDPDRVDLERFPALSNIEYNRANLTAGDCLFIPSGWILHERSAESSVEIVYNLDHQQASKIDLNDAQSCSEYDSKFTLDQVDWSNAESEPQNLRDVMINLINSKSNSFEKWQETFSKHLSFDLNSDPETSAIFDEFYGIIDVNGDGEITLTEVEQIDGIHQHHISDILYEMVKIVNEKQASKLNKNEEETDEEHSKTEL